MGSSQNKDEDIDIYMQVNRAHYIAGDYVQGYVYLNAKKTKPYKNLVIRLVGDQHVQWYQHYGNNQTAVYSNNYQNYDSVFTIMDFNGRLNEGQYSFPFSFILPSALSGSFHHSQANIRYSLMAVLNHPIQAKNAQIYTLYLNIQEPIRKQIGGMNKNQSCRSKCCGCCLDYGLVTLSIVSDKNFAISGETLTISGFVDNSKGRGDIKNAKIVLEQKVIVISSDNTVRDWDIEETYLGQIGTVITGQTKNFNVPIKIPQNLKHYTSIGSVTGRYFLIGIKTEMGCCAQPCPQIYLHLIIQSTNPQIQKQNKIDPPSNWSPVESKKIVCTSMRQFVYSPNVALVHKNEYGRKNMKSQDQGTKPYFRLQTEQQMK